MNITIKRLETEEEIRGKAYVHLKSWQEAYAGIVDAAYLNRRTLESCIHAARESVDSTVIAKDGERVVGFVTYGKNEAGDMQNAGEIVSLYVLADYYGQKIGYRLTKEALNHLRDCSQIAAWVLEDNRRAIAFYERLGFHFDGLRGATQTGASAARMVLERPFPTD